MDKENNIIPFSFGDHLVRVVKDEDENPWWVAKDVCKVLRIKNPSDAAKNLEDDEKGIAKIYTSTGEKNAVTINESGLYTLIIRSNKPEAKKFRRWITHEVLPSIRKTGQYRMPGLSRTGTLKKPGTCIFPWPNLWKVRTSIWRARQP